MTLNFFSKPKDKGSTTRHKAVETVRVWLWGRRHLPPDLIAALHVLIPELGRDGQHEADPFD